jgi:HlyD family secretion protein
MKIHHLILPALLLTACGDHADTADAYGNFEAVETLVSAKGSGELLRFDVEEGMTLEAGEAVGVIDTTMLDLQAREIAADRDAIASQHGNVVAQIEVQDARMVELLREQKRLQQMFADQAATQKQLDEIDSQVAVLKKQTAAIGTQNPGIAAQVRGLDAKEAGVRKQIADMHVVNPVHGTVVVKLAETHELAAPGKPLYRIADMDTLELRAYISGARLAGVKLGAHVQVGIDRGDSGVVRRPGRVSWISNEAEFTPKTIQTREERVDMVYAFKVRVANSGGLLKNGMPGEVYLNTPPE